MIILDVLLKFSSIKNEPGVPSSLDSIVAMTPLFDTYCFVFLLNIFTVFHNKSPVS